MKEKMQISSYLGKGQENAISARVLAELTGKSRREVVRMIHEERRRGAPIVSDTNRGYYLPATESEKARCVRSLRHRAREIEKAANGIERGNTFEQQELNQ